MVATASFILKPPPPAVPPGRRAGDPVLGALACLVAAVFAVDPAALAAPTRARARIALARQVAMYVAHVGLGLTLTEVGRRFGRDRTTAGHACRLIEDMRDDGAFDLALGHIERAALKLAALSARP